MRLLVLQAVLISALYQAAWAYDLWDLSPEEQLALEEVLEAAYYNPETRNEDPETNKPVIPPYTFVQGGAGEGKQHLGPNLIPNKPRIVPEINPPVYDNPPNPCSATDMDTLKTEVESVNKAALAITCRCAADWDDEGVDCAEARKCCIPQMPNKADFVKDFQEAGKKPDDNDIFQDIGFSKRSSFVNPNEYRANPKVRRNRYFVGPAKKTVVAKKSPQLASGRLPVM
ncbi:uncharacterized protein [Amphiura filiformis]|uniref:uncharacterized protein isoform X2 n=1 Tax=Amphiura filiformis TaxID=82378 RepID=UPI003B20BD03